MIRCSLYTLCFISALMVLVLSQQYNSVHSTVNNNNDNVQHQVGQVSIDNTWLVVGPFPIGNREVAADPLESLRYHGSIFNWYQFYLNSSQTSNFKVTNYQFASELADGGLTNLTFVNASQDGSVNIPFSFIRWDTITGPLGDIGAYFQGWAIGSVESDSTQDVTIQCFGTREIYIDSFDQRVIGDPYYDGTSLSSFTLSAGAHNLFVRLIDAGGTSFQCKINPVDIAAKIVVLGDVLTADLVSGNISSSWISLTVLNTHNDFLQISNLEINSEFITLAGNWTSVRLAPNQPLPLVIPVQQLQSVPASMSTIIVPVSIYTSAAATIPVIYNVTIYHRQWGQSYKFTFLDFDQSVHYAVVIPPAATCPDEGCPILLSTHGAGVEADEIINGAWAGAYQSQKAAWIYLPTGRRRFGYDWQGPGLWNVWHGLQFFAEYLPGVPMDARHQYRANSSYLLFAGHSMGGHGCLTISTHYADLALASAPAAGWVKSELYTPYFTSVGYEYVDASLRGILESSITDYNSDLHISNLLGIDCIFRMGGDDTNVPPYHLRRMGRLQYEQGGDVIVSEIPGQPHWWNGVVDDAQMQQFFDNHLYQAKPSLPVQFTFTCFNPSVCGTKGGIRILQNQIIGRVAKVRVTQQGSTWYLQTDNVRRFVMEPVYGIPVPATIIVNGINISYTSALSPNTVCQMVRYGQWTVCSDTKWLLSERNPKTYGPLRAVMNGAILIVYGTQGDNSNTQAYILQANWIAQNWYYQGRGIVNIISDVEFAEGQQYQQYNYLFLGVTQTNSAIDVVLNNNHNNNNSSSVASPIVMTKQGFQIGPIHFTDVGTGALVLLPHPYYPATQLSAIITGTDIVGFRKAAAFFPYKSAVITPDWIVTSIDAGWKGVGGLSAAGFWNNQWKYDDLSSYLNF